LIILAIKFINVQCGPSGRTGNIWTVAEFVPQPKKNVLYTWSAGAFAFTQTAYLLKLVIPTTNALPRWRLNVETKTKHTLHSSRRLSFNELMGTK